MTHQKKILMILKKIQKMIRRMNRKLNQKMNQKMNQKINQKMIQKMIQKMKLNKNQKSNHKMNLMASQRMNLKKNQMMNQLKKMPQKNKEDTKNEEKKDLRQGKGDIIRKTLNNTNPNKDKFNDSNNKFKAPLKNLNYNDITRQLNSYEISDVIKGLKENIPNEDLVNVWIQTLGVCKSGGHDMISNLKNYEKSCLSEYKKIILPHYGGPPREKNPEEYWEKCLYDFEVKLLNASYEYNSKFYELLNKKDKLFKIKKFLFSCLDEFSNLKKQLYKEYKMNYMIIL